MNAFVKHVPPVRPQIQEMHVGDDVVTMLTASNRDAETITEFTIEFTSKLDLDGYTDVDFNKTCTVKLYSEVTGEVVCEDVEPTPEWAHHFIAAEIGEDLDRIAYQNACDEY